MAGSLILFWLRLPHPALPCVSCLPRLQPGDQLDDAIQQLDIFQLDATSFSLAIYQLPELVMTPLNRQIDDLNLHSPLSLVLKRWSVSELHSLTCQFLCRSDVMFLRMAFFAEAVAFCFECFAELGGCLFTIGVCNPV